MKAFLVSVNWRTGERAGGIMLRNRHLPTDATWQSAKEGVELRLVKDESLVAKYGGCDGVTLIEGAEAINSILAAWHVEHEAYRVVDPDLMRISIEQRGIRLDALDRDAPEGWHRELYERGVVGVVKRTIKPRYVTAEDFAAQHGVE